MSHIQALFLLDQFFCIMNIPLNFDELEKTCPNLIYGITPRLKINVCGHMYEIYTEILDAYPDTLLGDPKRREIYRLNADTLFFHRHPSFFAYILYYYIQGFIQRPKNIPHDLFVEECRFFSIPFDYDEDPNFVLHSHQLNTEEQLFNKWFDVISFLISIVSCGILLFNDLPKSDFISNQLVYNSSLSNSVYGWIDLGCSIWFMIEFYFLYFYREAKRNYQLVVDILSIAPIFVFLLIHTLSHWFPYLRLFYPFYICFKSFRVFRLIRYIRNFDLIIETLLLSFDYVSIPLILFSIFIIPFGIIIYLLERTDPSSTIVDANIGLTWAIETITTIGFGEYIPRTYQGRIFSILTCIVGLIIVALPIPSVFQNFQIIYQNSLKRNLWTKYS